MNNSTHRIVVHIFQVHTLEFEIFDIKSVVDWDQQCFIQIIFSILKLKKAVDLSRKLSAFEKTRKSQIDA